MTMLLLGALGWCVVSVAVGVLWASVTSGARAGAARNRPAWQQPARAPRAAAVVPAPRTQAPQPVAV